MRSAGTAAVVLPTSRTPVACVAIPVVRNAALLGRTLASLARLDGEVPFEVRLVLNAATDEVRHYVRSDVRGAEVHHSPVNLGNAAAYNRAFAASGCRWLVTMHDDAEVDPGWLDALVETARSTPDAGAVGSRVVGRDGLLRDVGMIIWRDGLTLAPWTGDPPAPGTFTTMRAVDYHGTVGLLVDREAWEGVGGFDDGYYPAYHVDTDFCMRLRRAGWRVLVDPRAGAMHHGGASSSHRYAGWLIARNRRRLARLHALALRDHGPPAPHDPSAVAREVARAARQAPGPRPPEASHGARALLAERLARPDAHYAAREISVLRAYAEDLVRSEDELRGFCDERGRAIEEINASATWLQQELEASTAAVEAYRQDRDRLAAGLVERDGALVAIRSLLGDRDEALAGTRVLLADREAALGRARAAVAQSDAALQDARGRLADLTLAVDAGQRERDALRRRSDLLDVALASRWWRLGERLRRLAGRGG